MEPEVGYGETEVYAGVVACHVTLRLGVIHAMEGWYHASIARSGPKFPPPASTDPLRAFVETLLLRDNEKQA
jgi:hypothetical protein